MNRFWQWLSSLLSLSAKLGALERTVEGCRVGLSVVTSLGVKADTDKD